MIVILKQTNIAHTIDLTADRAKYDECAKKLLTYNAVIAWILKSCTKEFSQYSVQFICDNCLTGDIEISQRSVHQDYLDKNTRLNGNQRIDGLNTEANSINEQTVYYDIRFKACLPDSDEPVQLIINLEIQLNDTPGYPLVTRGFYYCARMISEQYGTVFTDEHYEKIQKVYSIWICPDPAKKRKNGIFKYHTVEDTIHGTPYTSPESYDLMEVVILNLGDADKESDLEILDLLNVLFSPSTSPEEKKQRLNDDFHIAMTEEFESEVQNMCNLSNGLVALGEDKKSYSLAQMMIENEEPLDKIILYTGYSVEKLKDIANTMGNYYQKNNHKNSSVIFPGSFVILLSFEAGFMSVSFLSIRLKRITQTPLQTTFYSTQGAEAIPQYRPLLLIWNFDSNLCAASLFRIA